MPLLSNEPKRIELPDLRLVGACGFANFFEAEIGQQIGGVWDRFFSHFAQIEKLKKESSGLFGLELYPPGFPKQEPRWYYMACAEVETLDAPQPSAFVSRFIPASAYACFTHRGTLDGLPKAFRTLYDEWLPASGVKLRGTHDLERYDDRFKGPADPESEVDILLPLA
ncbi:MAG: GyrI-like domain-containing protein [Planctomycetes bacterium]|nr:GyrI-like domain-containing protein [Planctomycetota bacterium]